MSDQATRKQSPRWLVEKWLWAIALAFCCFFAYHWLGTFTAARQTHFYLEVDSWVPFLPWTVWFYLPFYVLIFHVGVFSIVDRNIYYRTIRGIALAFVGCAVFFLVVPSSYPLPALPEDANWLNARFLTWVRQIDVPNNTFPSSHVALSFACAFGTLRDSRKWGVVTMVMACSLAVSILTTKQHYVVDSIGGIFMGYIAYRVSFWKRPAQSPERAAEVEARRQP